MKPNYNEESVINSRIDRCYMCASKREDRACSNSSRYIETGKGCFEDGIKYIDVEKVIAALESEMFAVDKNIIEQSCPFCGSTEHSVQQIDCEDREGVPMRIVCDECGAAGPWDYVRDGNTNAIYKAWCERVWLIY